MKTVTGLSCTQFEKLMGLGMKMDGRKILIRTPKHGIESLGESRAYYTIELPTADHDDVWLIPTGNGHTARSAISRQEYAYSHGGSLFVAAVDAAKELASGLGF